MNNLLIGTSGFSYWHWRGRFYPDDLKQSSWLTYYANTFNALEVNVTFYRSVRTSTFEKWTKMVPENFVFAVKGSRVITHINRLRIEEGVLTKFSSSLSGLGRKVKCILWQLPPSFKADSSILRDFLEKVLRDKMMAHLHHAFEFRHESWFIDKIYSLMKDFNCGLVISHSARYPCVVKRTADFMYFRFHGGERLYASNYENEELEEWAKVIKNEMRIGDVYVFFNNDINAYAVYNALTLRSLLATGVEGAG